MAGKEGTKAATTKRASTAKKATDSSHEFVLQAVDAQEVYVAGTFNGWALDDHSRMRKYKGGVWKKKIRLAPGRYEYQFVVDGVWWTDPANPNRIGNTFGTENSLVEMAG
ncbi:MAG: isoamylase early set domain-containing protein [Thermodesulfobacteriota bacterium]